MIIVGFDGGLGNQMLRYVFTRKLIDTNNLRGAEQCAHQIVADTTIYRYDTRHYGYELEKIFGIRLDMADPAIVKKLKKYIPRIQDGSNLIRMVNKLEYFIYRQMVKSPRFRRKFRNVVFWRDFTGDIEQLCALSENEDWYLYGFWPDEKCFEDVEGICNCFSFPPLPDSLQELALRFEACESVSIHVRRGDFAGTNLDICGVDYYKKAVQMLLEYVSNPVFFLFSEDRDYIDENFGFLPDRHYVGCNTGENSFRDMQMMSMTKHIITANSTFSFWSAFLNRNPHKIVISPSKDAEPQIRNEWHWGVK